MAKSKRVVPDFMVDNPDDTFMFMMPLSLKPDLDEDIGNSYFNVAVKNLTTGQHFITPVSPEIFFTRFKLHKAYKNGKLDKQVNKKSKIENRTYNIDIRLVSDQYNLQLEVLLEANIIDQLLGWNKTYLDKAKKISCCLIKVGLTDLIIPHYAIAIYYYYRSTLLREATLRCSLEDLHFGYDCNPDNASIIVPNYISEGETPFIHRFLCQTDAIEAFEKIGTYLKAYIRKTKDIYPNKKIYHVPIKAKFPQRNKFSISTRSNSFFHEGRHYVYVHEITDDDSPMGFSKFTTFFQGKKIVTETDDIDNLPTVPVKIPSDTTERLKSEHASRRYKNNIIVANRRLKCSSLKNIEMLTDKLTDDEVLERLKIMEETLSDETVDQSLTDSSKSGENKIRKARISSKGEKFQEMNDSEHTYNFDEFNQYVDYMGTQKTIKNLQIRTNKKMKTVMNRENGNPNSKCMIHGRSRQYITATFEYKDIYVGLLELENSASSSTWVISSKHHLGPEMLDEFLKYYVEDNKTINDLKKQYDGKSGIKFKTKNHEKTSKIGTIGKTRWVAGVLGKIIS